MKQIILINRQGRPEFTLAFGPKSQMSGQLVPFLLHAGRMWGFGVALIDGRHFYYEL